jgi:hypothetical protein
MPNFEFKPCAVDLLINLWTDCVDNSCVKMRMARLPQLAVFSFAAIHLLLFSICPVSSGRIYRTNDAVVVEGSCGVGPALPPQRSLPVAAIVGGSKAIPNSWPFIVISWWKCNILRRSDELWIVYCWIHIPQVGLRISGKSAVFCGGSIISTTRILTAAHCVDKWDNSFWYRSNLYLVEWF